MFTAENAEGAEKMHFTAEAAENAEKRENQISAIVLDAAIAVHTALGPGLLESAFLFEIEREKIGAADQFSCFAFERWI